MSQFVYAVCAVKCVLYMFVCVCMYACACVCVIYVCVFVCVIYVCVCLCVICVVLGNISIFWKYRDISFDNILYRGDFSISKYRISILIIFIVFMYATHEVYSLDMSTRFI